MEQIVRVRRLLPEDMAEVVKARESACSGDCHQCAGCGAAKETVVLTAKNPIGAQPGDRVKLRSESSPLLKAALVLYILPLVCFIAGYLVGENRWGRGALVSLCAFVLSMVPIRLMDRWLMRKLKYTIVDFAGDGPC